MNLRSASELQTLAPQSFTEDEELAGVRSICAPDYCNYFMLFFLADIKAFGHYLARKSL